MQAADGDADIGSIIMDLDTLDQSATGRRVSIVRVRAGGSKHRGQAIGLEGELGNCFVYPTGVTQRRSHATDNQRLKIVCPHRPRRSYVALAGIGAARIIAIGAADFPSRAGPHQSAKAVVEQTAKQIAVVQITR
jgi:hypothetical protein